MLAFFTDRYCILNNRLFSCIMTSSPIIVPPSPINTLGDTPVVYRSKMYTLGGRPQGSTLQRKSTKLKPLIRDATEGIPYN